ncbi:1-phosphofructokinase [Bacillus sp. V3B]|uniref:1-phosphofructokinase n=1 Tax=Bacillus sp. V3B TaxID=2804915 RepID=UPI00210CBB2C|nr:1-phosphofructokinase [Bacillus sp. V3B]MCQ6274217.1 1-phosphofructokinase [Bacillus sp. V3B]
MIHTLTLNPSVDYIVKLDKDVKIGELNRSTSEITFPGGKGINVSRVLNRVGVKSKALGFVGGFTGDYIEKYLHHESIETNFIKVEEDTRINIKLKTGKETEINAKGPTIQSEHFEKLKEIVSSLTAEDILVLAGSIPSSLPGTTYEELVKVCEKNRTAFVVDTEGDLLMNVLAYKPILIKPNHHELGNLFGTALSTPKEAIPYAKQLIEMGAQNVIVSLAGDGAVFVNEKYVFVSSIPKGEVKSSVGAGDSMVAGFLAKYEKTQDVLESFQYSVASGSATAFALDLCTKEKVEELLPQVKINQINKEKQ